MSTTTSLKLPDALKTTIAKVAAFEGKTAHALMVDTLQAAMEVALVRKQFTPMVTQPIKTPSAPMPSLVVRM